MLLHGATTTGEYRGRDDAVMPLVNGSFAFLNVPAQDGTYVVQVASRQYEFLPVKVFVCMTCTPHVRAEMHNMTRKLAYPLLLQPAREAVFVREREPTDWLGMLTNPMVMMMLVMGGMSLMVSRMSSSLDDKTRAEVANSPMLKMMSSIQTGDIAGALHTIKQDAERKAAPARPKKRAGGGAASAASASSSMGALD